MIEMSANPVPWRARIGRAVMSLTLRDCVALTVAVVVLAASSFVHPSLTGFLLVGLGGAVVMGGEKN